MFRENQLSSLHFSSNIIFDITNDLRAFWIAIIFKYKGILVYLWTLRLLGI